MAGGAVHGTGARLGCRRPGSTALRRVAGIGAAALVLVVAGCGGSDNKATASTASTSASSAATTTTAPAGTPVAFENVEDHFTPFTPTCSPIDPADCITPASSGSADIHGDLTGTAVAAGAASIYKDSNVASVLIAFRGTVASCGTGRLVMVSTGTITAGEWKVVEKAGSDDLQPMTGTGTYTVDGTTIHYKGEVHCK